METTKTKLSYYDQLKHPSWQRRRLEILESCDFECSNCGSKEKTLEIHHSYYWRGKRLWEYPDHALKCYCSDCHKEAEVKKKRIEEAVAYSCEQEQITGYALGSILMRNDVAAVYVNDCEEAIGIADYCGLDPRSGEEAIIKSIVLGKLTKSDLFKIIAKHGSSKGCISKQAEEYNASI